MAILTIRNKINPLTVFLLASGSILLASDLTHHQTVRDWTPGLILITEQDGHSPLYIIDQGFKSMMRNGSNMIIIIIRYEVILFLFFIKRTRLAQVY